MSGPFSINRWQQLKGCFEGGFHVLLNVGKIVNTHGIRGELRVWPQTDFPEIRFKAGGRLLMIPPEAGEPVSVEVQSAREHKNVYIVKLKGFDNINEVERFKGWALKVAESERVPLPEGEYYIRDIVGCEVVTDEAELLGIVADVLSPGANDVWVIDLQNGKQLLLPVIDDVVLHVDVKAKRIQVHLMEGLL